MPRKTRPPSDYVTCRLCLRDFGAITVRHLRAIHGFDGDHPIEDYKRQFGLRTAMCPDARKKVSEAKEMYWGRRGQHWTKAKVIAAIRKIHRAGESLHRKCVPNSLYMAGRRYFKNWKAAIERAGLDYGKTAGVRRWNRQSVIAAIRQLHERGELLTATSVERKHPALFRAATRHFPYSWAKALRAAGLDPAQHKMSRSRWSPESAREWLRKRIAKGTSLLARDAPLHLVRYVQNRLKTSWTAFVESFGIAYPGVKKRYDWTKQKFLAELRRWKAEGHRLNYRAVKLEYQALIHQARKYFGSWDRARAAARV